VRIISGGRDGVFELRDRGAGRLAGVGVDHVDGLAGRGEVLAHPIGGHQRETQW
jgi:hypothetical protein